MMMRLTLFSMLALAGSSAGAQPPQAAPRSASDSAKTFSLDLPAVTASADPVPRVSTAESDTPPVMLVAFTLDTPIGQLIADPKAKAVLDKNLPGLSDDPNLPKFQSMSLRQFQPMTGGQLSDALLAKTGADLAAIGPTSNAAPVAMPAPLPTTSTKRIDSGR